MHNDLIDLLNRLSNEIDNLRTILHSGYNIAREVDSGACSAPTDRTEVGLLIEEGLRDAVAHFDQAAEQPRSCGDHNCRICYEETTEEEEAVPGTITIAPGEWYEYNPGPPVSPWSSGLTETRTELKLDANFNQTNGQTDIVRCYQMGDRLTHPSLHMTREQAAKGGYTIAGLAHDYVNQAAERDRLIAEASINMTSQAWTAANGCDHDFMHDKFYVMRCWKCKERQAYD